MLTDKDRNKLMGMLERSLKAKDDSDKNSHFAKEHYEQIEALLTRMKNKNKK